MIKQIKQIFNFLRLLKAMINLSKKPDNPEFVFDISDACNRLNMYGLSRQVLLKDATTQKSIEEMWFIPEFNLNELIKYPEGTLGHEYAKHMLHNKFDPEFYRRSDIHNDITYLTVRMRQTHDLWHVLTNFPVTVGGEIGLQGFVFAQTGLPISMILMSGSLLRASLKDPFSMPDLVENISQGWMMGKKAKSIFPVKWEERWATPLADIQREFNITPLTDVAPVVAQYA